jgi:hypothetical protein
VTEVTFVEFHASVAGPPEDTDDGSILMVQYGTGTWQFFVTVTLDTADSTQVIKLWYSNAVIFAVFGTTSEQVVGVPAVTTTLIQPVSPG